MEIYNQDCLIGMKNIPDKSIDMILTDLPYGVTGCHWDSVIPLDKLWEEYKRIIKDDGAIVLFATQPFTSMLVMSNLKGYKHSWVWHKKNAGNMLVAKYQPLKTTEDILVFSKNGKKVNYYPILEGGHKERQGICGEKRSDLFSGIKSGLFKTSNNKRPDQRYPKHLIEFSNASRKEHYHPTQKPVELLEYLIKTYTNEKQTVLDSTFGSGSTAIACINTNRYFIGFEMDSDIFQTAKNRIDKHLEAIKNV